jgi:ribonucleotide reductase alpha subunit
MDYQDKSGGNEKEVKNSEGKWCWKSEKLVEVQASQQKHNDETGSKTANLKTEMNVRIIRR